MRPAMTLELLATPAEVSGVRRALRSHGIDVQLCASELVTNVIRHVGEGVPVTVRVWPEEGGRVRLGVTDPDPRALPVLVGAVGAGAEAESGRGLALLDALAVRWGVEREANRKTVWCELFTEAAADAVVIPGTPERPGRRRPSAGALGHSSARS
ncbi:ATP-binding protein [Streptomyces hawaiiensis]|uniref:ATP-binding protein n=1 Tax=Streptomyces hawaiiensis TaxID=67305 RepID=UPI003662BB57